MQYRQATYLQLLAPLLLRETRLCIDNAAPPQYSNHMRACVAMAPRDMHINMQGVHKLINSK